MAEFDPTFSSTSKGLGPQGCAEWVSYAVDHPLLVLSVAPSFLKTVTLVHPARSAGLSEREATRALLLIFGGYYKHPKRMEEKKKSKEGLVEDMSL